MNRVEVMGRLARPPEFQLTKGGASLLTMTVAVPSTPRWDKDLKKDVARTNWIAVNVWFDLAEHIASLNWGKGEHVWVVGELDQSEWEDKDGNKVSKTRVKANFITSLDHPGQRRTAAAPEPTEPDEAPF